MADISQLQKQIEDGIKEIEIPYNIPELYDPVRYTLSLGGKRIRPLLALLACDMFDGLVSACKPSALALELFHNFSLIHDDLMDEAPIRRGKATVYRKWDANTAILSGDVMFVLAYDQLNQGPVEYLRDSIRIFNTAAKRVCEGQQLDMVYAHAGMIPIVDYLEMIRLKTAELLAASLQMGALIAGKDASVQEKLHNAGVNFGIAFQLQDDLLDSYGTSEHFGKAIGGDIVANKKTYLTLKAYETASAPDKTSLRELYSEVHSSEKEKIAAVTSIYERTNVKKFAEEMRDSYFRQGVEILQSIDATSPKKAQVITFAETLLNREK